MKETILFPSKEEALTVFKMLEKEYKNFKYDSCNGIDVETIYLETEEEEIGIYEVTHSIEFQTVIKLEKTEYCLYLNCCNLCCHISPGIPDIHDPFVTEIIERLHPLWLNGRKAG